MAGKNTAVMGLFRNREEVEIAIDKLKDRGFRSSDISVLFADSTGSRDFAHEKETKLPEGTTAGAGAGAVIGGTLGWLLGLGTLAIPGLGPFVAAGPLMALLAGAGAGGALGGVVGALVGMGIPEYEAKRYEGLIREGRALVSVHCDDSSWVQRAKDTLKAAGGTDIASQSEASTDTSYDSSSRPGATSTASRDDIDSTIPYRSDDILDEPTPSVADLPRNDRDRTDKAS
jgi:hypothetical protein